VETFELLVLPLWCRWGSTLLAVHMPRSGPRSISWIRSFDRPRKASWRLRRIKIDRSFVRDLAERTDCKAIIRAVAGLGASLGISTTAEGVETLHRSARPSVQPAASVGGHHVASCDREGSSQGCVKGRKSCRPYAIPSHALWRGSQMRPCEWNGIAARFSSGFAAASRQGSTARSETTAMRRPTPQPAPPRRMTGDGTRDRASSCRQSVQLQTRCGRNTLRPMPAKAVPVMSEATR
jgi:EAL domain